MKKIFVSTLLVLASISCANATDWVEIGSNSALTTYLDADRIKHQNKALDHRAAWVKLKYKKAQDGNKAGEYTLSNQVIDCKNTRFSVGTIVNYTSNGQVKDQTTNKTGWIDIPPGSNFDYVAETVCSYPYL